MLYPPSAQLRDIRDEVHGLATANGGVIRGFGISGDAVNVGLRADAESLAAQLHERHGDRVRVTLGVFPYPPDRTPTDMERHVIDVLRNRPVDDEISIRGLEASLELTESTVVAGRDGRGRVTLRNVGRTNVSFSSARPLVGGVRDPASGESIGGHFGGIAGTGQGVHLSPGQEQIIDVIFGTTSWDLQRGYAVPPGRYVVTTRVPINDSPQQPGRRRYLIVAPADLTIVGHGDYRRD
jgi:hypothetical protein